MGMSDKTSYNTKSDKKKRGQIPNESELILAVFKNERWKEIANAFDVHYNTVHNIVKQCDWYHRDVHLCREKIKKLAMDNLDSAFGRFCLQENIINLNQVVAEKTSTEPLPIYSTGGALQQLKNDNRGLPQHLAFRYQQLKGRYGR